ncbi:MAG: hypothetical protein INQ03_09155 [Candidatus Heimdallarchaeota archaeon]|nr:hypothetical protein [Candidatus Heimdallarchaeota archaeon]
MSNAKIELLFTKILQVILEAIKGEDAPYNFSKIVSAIKKEFPDFPKNLEMKKSADLVDYMIQKGLITKAFPKGKSNLYLQPVIPPNQWIQKIAPSDIDEDLFYGDPYNIPIVNFKDWISFLDFIDGNRDLVRIVGYVHSPNFNEKGFYVVSQGVCYFTKTFDFETIANIREVIAYGMNYNKIHPGDFSLNVGNYLQRFRNKENGRAYEYNMSNLDILEVSYQFHQNNPYANYQKLREVGFQSYDHYIESKKVGLPIPDLYDMYTSEKYDDLDHEYKILAILAGFENSDELEEAMEKGFIVASEFRAAKEGQFENQTQFRKAINLGFKDKESFNSAMDLRYNNYDDFSNGSKGNYSNGNEYYEARNGGFENVYQFREAKSIGINNLADYFKWLEQRDNRITKAREKLVGIIDTFKEDSYPITKIMEYIKPIFPDFTASDLEYTLLEDEEIRNMGNYREDLKIFIKGEYKFTPPLPNSNNKVVIDGSNVAHHGKNKTNTKPMINNIRLMIDALHKREIPFVFYVKSNLKYQIDEKEEFEKLIFEGIITELPAGAEDDEYILKHALTTGSSIISNDKFRNYQKENPTYADAIKNITITFDIVDDVVTFSGKLDDWLKSPRDK